MLCTGDCAVCGKCGGLPVLESFTAGDKPPVEPREGFGIAADIGTTGVVLALAELSSGSVLSRRSFMNPQRRFGPDVISRITASADGRSEDLRRAITESVSENCRLLLESSDVHPGLVTDMTVACNTVMAYLMLGLPCVSLGVSPFRPEYGPEDGHNFHGVFGASEINNCPVRITPWLSAFAGGDVTAGLLHVSGARRFMLMDLGTNGELALYDGGTLTVASAAAGPAFEGADRGRGASGVIDDLAGLLRDGHLDETGLLAAGAPETLGQKEIRGLQLAKSALRSGLEILLESAGMGCGGLDALYLAGGIGQAMDINSAVTIGLIPDALRHKTMAVGNASLAGALRILTAPVQSGKRVAELRQSVREINLAVHPDFNGLIMKYIDFC